MIQEYAFGPWLPDQTDFKNPGLEQCKNTVPSPNGYLPVRGLVASEAAVTGTILGSLGVERADGTPVVCVATTSDIFVIVSGTATPSGLSLSLSVGDWVSFAQFGESIFATTKNGDTWILNDIEADTTFGAAPAFPPNGMAVARVDDFLVLGNLLDGTEYPYRVQWSAFNNPTAAWGTDIATQADYQDLDAQQGPVTAISGGTFGMVFQKFGISRMDYIGGSSVFRFDLYEKNRGAASGQSVVRVGSRAYFLSFDGFFVTDGASVQPISRGKIWQWFTDNANLAYIEDVVGAVDWQARCIIWAFAGGDGREFTKQLRYNWETEWWSWVDQAIDFPVTSSKDGLTLEQVGNLYPLLDEFSTGAAIGFGAIGSTFQVAVEGAVLPIPLDSPVFRPAGRTIKAFANGALCEFTGPTLEATFIGGSLQPFTGKRTYIRGVTPLIANEDENTICAIGYRDRMTRGYLTSPSRAIGSIGYAPFNVDGRYFRAINIVPAGATWGDAYGYQLDVVPGGEL